MTDEEKRLAACARAKAWRLANPERDKATHAAHAAKNPAREARRKADWAASNKTHVAAQMAAHYAANKDKIVARSKKWVTDNAARAAQNQEAWRKRVSLRRCEQASARRAGMPKATPAWTNRFFVREAFRLARQRTVVLGFKWHVDHIVPLKSNLVCGLHVENNLRVVPKAVNLAKGNRHWPDMP